MENTSIQLMDIDVDTTLLTETNDIENNICGICFDKPNCHIKCNECNKNISCQDCLKKISELNNQCPYCRNDIEKILIKEKIIIKTTMERTEETLEKICCIFDYIFDILKIIFFIICVFMIFVIVFTS